VQSARPGAQDLVLWRKDGLPAYQLAVSVDDGWQAITQVVRGADLLETTAAQRYLLGALGHMPPTYGHLPLLRGEDGRKLSKQNGAPALDNSCALDNLREALSLLGQTPARGVVTPERLLAKAIDSWAPGRLPAALQPGARGGAPLRDDAGEETRL
jgi:glutamyl-Q tRNA(Asp) synthetase